MVFNTADQAFSYIESFTNLEKSPNLTAREYRLERMFQLLDLFDNPQSSFKSIHVAGSKGKGSTATFLASILKSNGYKTGLYCSPHVESYKERISAAGTFFSDETYSETAAEMFNLINEKTELESFTGGPPTTFELLTLLSFLIFKKTGCEWCVFETGLGGRLDATNVIIPEASVITVIELEHTEFLGSTISAVAGEKAGIIKKGVPVFSAEQEADAEKVIRDKAAAESSEIFFPPDLIKSNITFREEGIIRSTLELHSGTSCSLRINSPGSYQMLNASLAVSALDRLNTDKRLFLPGFDPASGTDKVVLPGRMELFKATDKNPAVMLDGAHTVKSVTAAAEAFYSAAEMPAVLLFGAVEGKNIEGMAEALSGRFSKIIITTPGTFKKSSPDSVFNVFKNRPASADTPVILEKDTAKAFQTAVDSGLPVLVTGSFYLAAEIRKNLVK